ncbi:CdiA C-terminal domain-containing protein [Baaleninema simplex]|uniref:CdiA C-terminal domain-containing protein n=1 Tax=Baaleninema simplex TaxID=2862350 RepID=UPI00192CC3DA|nr:hypothetical protein [Baaleninema simplex]
MAEDPNGIEALAEAAPNPESARRFREQGNDVIDRYGREEGIEMLQEGTLAKRATSDGHTLKVLSDGKIVRCSTCGEFYDKYQDILDDPDYQPLRQKFKELEAKAQADPESVIDEIDDLDRLLREARQTKPSRQPDVGATPTGRPARIRPNESPENIRALQQENDSAIVLAQKGYQVEQNPRIPETSRNPDYRIEGRVFDNYAPTTRNVRSIWTIVQEKVTSGQTERIILNLNDNNLSLNALEKQFSEWEIPGLKEVIIVQNGNVIPFWP